MAENIQTERKYMEHLQASKCKHCGFVAETPEKADEHEALPEPGQPYLTKGSVLGINSLFPEGLIINHVFMDQKTHKYEYHEVYFGTSHCIHTNVGYVNANSLKRNDKVLTPEEFTEFLESAEPHKKDLGVEEFRRVTQEEFEALIAQEEAKGVKGE